LVGITRIPTAIDTHYTDIVISRCSIAEFYQFSTRNNAEYTALRLDIIPSALDTATRERIRKTINSEVMGAF